MLHMCVYMHSRFVENHPIRILEDGPLISEVVLSHCQPVILTHDLAPNTRNQGLMRRVADVTMDFPLCQEWSLLGEKSYEYK
jgi:hypothetical protein